VVVFPEIVDQFPVHTGGYDIRETRGIALVTGFSFIHMDRFAILVEFGGISTVIIAEIMQMDLNAGVVQRFQFAEHIDRAAIIGGPGYIQGNNM
jgi:hypothetical protein